MTTLKSHLKFACETKLSVGIKRKKKIEEKGELKVLFKEIKYSLV